MKQKLGVAAVFAIGIAILVMWILFMKKTADAANEKSKNIMEEFKAVDESLEKNKFYYDSIKKELKDSLAAKLSK